MYAARPADFWKYYIIQNIISFGQSCSEHFNMCNLFWTFYFVRLLYVFSVTLRFCFLVGDIMMRGNNVIVIHAPSVYDAQANQSSVSYSKNEIYEIRQCVYNNREFLQIPVTTWFNIRKYKLNRKRTRRGTRGGKPKRKNYGVNIENLHKIETVKERPVKSFERKFLL